MHFCNWDCFPYYCSEKFLPDPGWEQKQWRLQRKLQIREMVKDKSQFLPRTQPQSGLSVCPSLAYGSLVSPRAAGLGI